MNTFTGLWTYLYCPESGPRTFEGGQEFFREAWVEKSWVISRIGAGKLKTLPDVEVEVDQGAEYIGEDGGRKKQTRRFQPFAVAL